jgi:hypothetical protein
MDYESVKKYIPAGICAILSLVFIPLIAFSTASYVVAFQNLDQECDNSKVLSLTTWLIVYASVNFGQMILITLFAFICHITSSISFFVGSYATLSMFVGLFNLAWNIVGAVVLFRDSMDCLDDATSLWAMTLAVLIFQWIDMCCSPSSNKRIKAYGANTNYNTIEREIV